MKPELKEEHGDGLEKAVRGLGHTLDDAVKEQKLQFEWMVTHSRFLSKSDLEQFETRINMKLSEIKTIVSTAKQQNREAFTEIGTKIADLNKQIADLIAGASDTDVTDADFLADLSELQSDAKALADIVPGSPTNTNPSATPPGTSPTA